MRRKSARLLGSTPSRSRAASWARVLRRGATTRRSTSRSTCRTWGAVKGRLSRPTKVTTAAERRTMAFIGASRQGASATAVLGRGPLLAQPFSPESRKLGKSLDKLKSPNLEKALVFLDDKLLGATSNAVERSNRRFRKAQKSIYSVRTKRHVEQRLALDMHRELHATG